jgi:arylsulfatase A-like enzyme
VPGAARPNIVVLIIDDVPYLDPQTPWQAMPQLSQSVIDHGVAFTDFHGETPLCCPGRVGFLTGLHTRSSHVFWNNAQLFHPQMSLATALHDSGYYTFEVGKYLNLYNRIAPTVPPGWDGFHANEGSPLYYNYRIWNDGGKPVKYGNKPADYATDVQSQLAVQEIQKAPANQPIFAWLGTTAAHNILIPAPRDANAPCTESPPWKTAATSEQDLSDKPAYVQVAPIKATSHNMVPLCRVLMSVDDLFAAVRSALMATGRWDNTMFIVTGDNGMSFGMHRLADLEDKRVPYATQLPFIASWPDGLGDQPRNVDARLQNIDFAPTICELVGCTLGPYPTGQSKPDGVSFLAALLGTGPPPVRDAVLSTQMEQKRSVPPWDAVTTTSDSPLAHQGCSSAAQGGCVWHYIKYGDGTQELYDDSGGPCYAWHQGMPGDPCELQNLAGNKTYASLMQTLDARLQQLVTTGQ